jgi:hypothetical protein
MDNFREEKHCALRILVSSCLHVLVSRNGWRREGGVAGKYFCLCWLRCVCVRRGGCVGPEVRDLLLTKRKESAYE